MSEPLSREENQGGHGAAFSVALFCLTAVIFLGVLILFGIDWYLYRYTALIDYEHHLLHPEDAWMLVFLFGIPLFLQAVGLIAMFLRLRRDKSLTTPYALCIFILSCCPFSYCLLWLLYMAGQHSWETLSYGALAVVIVSLVPVILMTYAIMWTPAHDPSKDASEIEVKDITNWTQFCSALKKDGAAFGVYRRRIFERLPAGLQNQLKAGDQSGFEGISKLHLVEELNRILKLPDLHLAINLDYYAIPSEARDLLLQRQKNLRDGEVQKLHRLLLEACLPETIRPLPQSSRLRSFITRWDRFLFNLKEGITKAHFSVLANFFAVFLGIAYLLGFAFAFHDQSAIAGKRTPDLYLAKTPLSRTGAQQIDDHAGAAPPAASVAKYTFYFDSISAHPNSREHSDVNEKAFVPNTNSPDPSKEWKEGINYNQAERISDDILKLTKKGEKLRVELVGSTDYCDLQSSPYSSNYELSEAREQNIKYLLMKKLSEKDKTQRDIEWLVLPVSSEGSPLAPNLEERTAKVKCEEQSKPRRRTLDKSGEDKLIASLENQKSTLDRDMGQLSTDDVTDLKNKVDELKRIVQQQHLTKAQEIEGSLVGIKSMASAINESKRTGLADDEKQELAKYAGRKKVELEESFDAFNYVDENGAKRVVVVSLTPIQDSRWFIPLSLMDYVYFTIYTITTTGSGDIVPTSSFAKFLCSSANILEVFFLVVFFNALLSVKGENRSARARDKK